MVQYEQFDQLFKFNPKAHFSHDAIEHILRTRRKYDGLLFIDRLFKVLGVKERKHPSHNLL